jgi:hypothetical protein
MSRLLGPFDPDERLAGCPIAWTGRGVGYPTAGTVSRSRQIPCSCTLVTCSSTLGEVPEATGT